MGGRMGMDGARRGTILRGIIRQSHKEGNREAQRSQVRHLDHFIGSRGSRTVGIHCHHPGYHRARVLAGACWVRVALAGDGHQGPLDSHRRSDLPGRRDVSPRYPVRRRTCALHLVTRGFRGYPATRRYPLPSCKGSPPPHIRSSLHAIARSATDACRAATGSFIPRVSTERNFKPISFRRYPFGREAHPALSHKERPANCLRPSVGPLAADRANSLSGTAVPALGTGSSLATILRGIPPGDLRLDSLHPPSGATRP